MLTVSFLSHVRITSKLLAEGEEDDVCKRALSYLVDSAPDLIEAATKDGKESATVVHLLQGPLRGGSLSRALNEPPFIWIYPVDVKIDGLDVDRFELPASLSINLSSFNHTRDKVTVLAGLDEILLASVLKEICDPMLAAAAGASPAF